jgi:hypothetical protein
MIMFLIHRLVSTVLRPHSLMGGISPLDLSPGGPKQVEKIFVSPLAGDSRAVPPKRNIGKKFLVKYCNFVVNLDHSL